MGIAALARACSGPMRAARNSVLGGASAGTETSGDVCMKTTVRPVETSVQDTVRARR